MLFICSVVSYFARCLDPIEPDKALDRLSSGDDPVTRFSHADGLWVYLVSENRLSGRHSNR
jgi:hypothetical protein